MADPSGQELQLGITNADLFDLNQHAPMVCNLKIVLRQTPKRRKGMVGHAVELIHTSHFST
jgi:hypothetical protein